MKKSRLVWPLVLVVSTVILAVLIGLNVESDFRFIVTFAYLLVCPGMAYIRLLRLSNPLMEWMLAIAASISIELLLSEIMVLTRLWSPNSAFYVIALFSVAGALIQVIFPAREAQKESRYI
jgi:hypothetical protein